MNKFKSIVARLVYCTVYMTVIAVALFVFIVAAAQSGNIALYFLLFPYFVLVNDKFSIFDKGLFIWE